MKVRPLEDKDIIVQRYVLGMIPIPITFLWCFTKRKVHPLSTEKKALYEILHDK